jgi:hypothetical protein
MATRPHGLNDRRPILSHIGLGRLPEAPSPWAVRPSPYPLPLGGEGGHTKKEPPNFYPKNFAPPPRKTSGDHKRQKMTSSHRPQLVGSGGGWKAPPRARQGPWYAAQNAARRKTVPQPRHAPTGAWWRSPPPPTLKVAPRACNDPTAPYGPSAPRALGPWGCVRRAIGRPSVSRPTFR